MKKIKTRYRFANEAPRIGCGERGVYIERGRKWVVITECATGARCRLPLAVFEKVKERRVVGRRV